MPKALYCSKVNPSSNCTHVIRGNTVQEVLSKAKAHAKEHGLLKMTPELMKKIESSIEDE